jgi:hypothetical protein
MTDEEFGLFQRLVLAVERIADHLDQKDKPRERRPASLVTATYTREDREFKDWKERAASPKGRVPEPPRDHN